MVKRMSEAGPICEWKTLGIGVLLLIVILAMVLYAIFFPLDFLCLIIDAIFIVLTVFGYFLVRSKRVRSNGFRRKL